MAIYDVILLLYLIMSQFAHAFSLTQPRKLFPTLTPPSRQPSLTSRYGQICLMRGSRCKFTVESFPLRARLLTTCSTVLNQKRSPLLRLPVELRNEIYNYALSGFEIVTNTMSRSGTLFAIPSKPTIGTLIAGAKTWGVPQKRHSIDPDLSPTPRGNQASALRTRQNPRQNSLPNFPGRRCHRYLKPHFALFRATSGYQ
jgi:hypothetical protein